MVRSWISVTLYSTNCFHWLLPWRFLIYAEAVVESFQITYFENVSGNAMVILGARRVTSYAAQSSRRGMVMLHVNVSIIMHSWRYYLYPCFWCDEHRLRMRFRKLRRICAIGDLWFQPFISLVGVFIFCWHAPSGCHSSPIVDSGIIIWQLGVPIKFFTPQFTQGFLLELQPAQWAWRSNNLAISDTMQRFVQVSLLLNGSVV